MNELCLPPPHTFGAMADILISLQSHFIVIRIVNELQCEIINFSKFYHVISMPALSCGRTGEISRTKEEEEGAKTDYVSEIRCRLYSFRKIPHETSINGRKTSCWRVVWLVLLRISLEFCVYNMWQERAPAWTAQLSNKAIENKTM